MCSDGARVDSDASGVLAGGGDVAVDDHEDDDDDNDDDDDDICQNQLERGRLVRTRLWKGNSAVENDERPVRVRRALWMVVIVESEQPNRTLAEKSVEGAGNKCLSCMSLGCPRLVPKFNRIPEKKQNWLETGINRIVISV